MELKLGDLVDNFNGNKKLCTHIAVQMHFTGFPNKLRATIGFSKCARNGPPRLHPRKKNKKKFSGHMIKCLLTELGPAGREIFGSRSGRTDLVRPDLVLNIFPSSPPTQSISIYYFSTYTLSQNHMQYGR